MYVNIKHNRTRTWWPRWARPSSKVRERNERHTQMDPISLETIFKKSPSLHTDPTHTGIQHRVPNSTFPPAAACMKHFIAYPAAVNGHDRSPIELASRTVKQLYAPPFRAAVREARVKSAMEVRVSVWFEVGGGF